MNPSDFSDSTAPPFDRVGADAVSLDHQSLITLAGCNYLGLAHDPAVLRAAHDALDQYGLSTSASRRTSGNTREHTALEAELADFLGFEGAVLTPDGYTANLVAAQRLAMDCCVALLDERAHASLVDAARCAGLEVRTYPHLDHAAAGALAGEHRDRGVAVMTDSVFATDGAIAPLRELAAALPESNAYLLVDDCHGFCVLGAQGEGTLGHLGLRDPRIRQTTTLAKGLGCFGGVACGPATWADHARRTCNAAVCTTPAPPAAASAARAALRLVRAEPIRIERLRMNIDRLRTTIRAAGFPAHDAMIPIFAIWLPSPAQTRALSSALREEGFFVPASEYPGGPSATYLRISVTARHRAEDLDRFGAALARLTPKCPARSA
ncbi:MAG: aminotransferase class I/II-fold pyridoxal phosphate-dependent enzyme [Phycisphaerales bacterium JB059]